jgi:hypothetical protein
MEEPRYDPKYRHAIARKVGDDWQIRFTNDRLPLNAFITYEYRVDDFLPVVWETEPASKEEREVVSVQVCNEFLSARFVTPHYYASEDRAIYFVDTQGFEQLICLACDHTQWVVDALNTAYKVKVRTCKHYWERYHTDGLACGSCVYCHIGYEEAQRIAKLATMNDSRTFAVGCLGNIDAWLDEWGERHVKDLKDGMQVRISIEIEESKEEQG